MALNRPKKLLAATALVVTLSGGASEALARGEASSTAPAAFSTQQRRAVKPRLAKTVADRQRRIEDGWMAEQLRAERASRRSRAVE